MRTRFRQCKFCGDLHALNAWPDNHREEPWHRSDHPAPYIVSDYLPGGVNGMWSPLGGQVDSKAAYYKSVRRAGCEIVANDPRAKRGPDPDRFAAKKDEVERDMIDARDMLSSDSVSEGDMANMMRAFNGPELKELPIP